MASQVSVQITRGDGNVAECEISGGSTRTLTGGTADFTIGAEGAVVSMLTVRRLGEGDIKIIAGKKALTVAIDGGKDKKLSRGNRLLLPKNAKRALVRERV